MSIAAHLLLQQVLNHAEEERNRWREHMQPTPQPIRQAEMVVTSRNEKRSENMGNVIVSRNTEGRTVISDDRATGGQGVIVRMAGGEEFDYTAVLEQAFGNQGAWLTQVPGNNDRGFPNASPQQWHFYKMWKEQEIDPISGANLGRKNQMVGGLVADTTKRSDRQDDQLAIWEPDTAHLIYLVNPDPTSGRPRAFMVYAEADSWTNSRGEEIGSLTASTFKRVLAFRGIPEAQDHLNRVRAALWARVHAEESEVDEYEPDQQLDDGRSITIEEVCEEAVQDEVEVFEFED